MADSELPRIEHSPGLQCCSVIIGETVVYVDYSELVCKPETIDPQVLVDVQNRTSWKSIPFQAFGNAKIKFTQVDGD